MSPLLFGFTSTDFNFLKKLLAGVYNHTVTSSVAKKTFSDYYKFSLVFDYILIYYALAIVKQILTAYKLFLDCFINILSSDSLLKLKTLLLQFRISHLWFTTSQVLA